MDILEKLNEANDVRVYSVYDSEFATYGRVIEGFDFIPLTRYMKENTEIPQNGNIYVPSVVEMENKELFY